MLDDRSFKRKEQDIKDGIVPATRMIANEMRDVVEELRVARSATVDSINTIQNVNQPIENTQVFNPFAFSDDYGNTMSSGGEENAMVRSIGSINSNPFANNTVNQSSPTSDNSHRYNGPSAFNESSFDQSFNPIDFMSKGGYSGAFILIAGAILAVLTFLVSYMVFSYLGV